MKFELDAVKRPFFKPGFPNPLKEVGTGAQGDECSHPQKDRKVNCHYFNRDVCFPFFGVVTKSMILLTQRHGMYGKSPKSCCTDALQEDLALFSSSTVLPSAKRSVADVLKVDTVDGWIDKQVIR